jgi:hypothetical protein
MKMNLKNNPASESGYLLSEWRIRKLKIKLTIVILFLSAAYTGHTETLFVFNPEAKASHIASIRADFENYLKSQGIGADVYVFAVPSDFQDSVGRLKPSAAIVASYYYNLMKSKYLWKALLAGHKEGEKVYNKVMVASKSVSDPLQLKDKSLAAVCPGSSSSYIDSMLPAGLSAENVRIVSVSKDIDAIMALGFEQVQAAIVTKENFEKLEKINPDAVRNLHILQSMNPIPYPKFVVFPEAGHIEQFIGVFKNITYEDSGKKILKFFDITGFNAEQ